MSLFSCLKIHIFITYYQKPFNTVLGHVMIFFRSTVEFYILYIQLIMFYNCIIIKLHTYSSRSS